MCLWQILGKTFSSPITSTVFAAVAAGAAVFAAIYIKRSWRETQRTWQTAKDTQSYQIMLEFMREYGKKEFGDALREVHEFYRNHDKDLGKMVKGFKQVCKNSSGDKNIPIDRARRTVSSYYQRLACMYVNNVLPKSLISDFWEKEDLVPIIEIVLALDTKAKPAVLDGKELSRDQWPPAFRNMERLRNAVLDHSEAT